MDVQQSFNFNEEAQEEVLSVALLTERIKELLEASFSSVWVSGEISNLSRPQSGHLYFTLKDAEAQIRGVIWRGTAQKLRFDLEDGMEVVCQGDLDVYPPRGSYQLVVRQVLPKGLGTLELALRKLREKLAAEGLFAVERKRPLPRIPRRIAFVTSPTGAAVRDFLQVLARRWPFVEVIIIPARVQGDLAAREIAQGIEAANKLPDPPDTLVVGRGGGSLEDLWPFNEEVVVRAIHASRIPVVSAVGHEIDVTLSDLVADVRALTPTEAAERVVPSRDEMLQWIQGLDGRLLLALQNKVHTLRSRWENLAARRSFRRPLELVRFLAQQVDDWSERLNRASRSRLQAATHDFKILTHRLEALSPLAVLTRGYSLTLLEGTGKVIVNSSELKLDDRIVTRYRNGSTVSRVEQVGNG